MIRKVLGLVIVFSFLMMSITVAYVPAFTDVNIVKVDSDINSGATESDSEKEEVRLVELEEFLVLPTFLIFVSGRNGVSCFPKNIRINLSPYFCLPYPPPNL